MIITYTDQSGFVIEGQVSTIRIFNIPSNYMNVELDAEKQYIVLLQYYALTVATKMKLS